jgi:hypothetical protein
LFYNLTVGVIKIISSPKKCSKLCWFLRMV